MTSGIGPEWFSAVGTVGALLIALVLFGYQTWDRRRDAGERRRAQAELVGATMGPLDRSNAQGNPMAGRTGIDLFNNSPSPVYGLVIGVVFIQGTGPESMERWLELAGKSGRAIPVTTTNILPPGAFRIWIDGVGWSSALSGHSGAEVAFTDRAGKHWIRRADGQLRELGEAPLDYFRRRGLLGPYEFQTPQRLGSGS